MMQIKRVIVWRALALALPASMALAGCADNGQTLSGILRDVDCAHGNMTVVTDEGKTVVMTIDTPDCNAQASNVGHRVEVDQDNDKASSVKVVQTTVINGTVVNVQNNQATIRRDDGREVNVVLDQDKTVVKKHGNRTGDYNDIDVNVHVKVEVNQVTNIAYVVVEEGDATGTPQATAEATDTPSAGMTPTAAATAAATSTTPASSPTAQATSQATATSAPQTTATTQPQATATPAY